MQNFRPFSQCVFFPGNAPKSPMWPVLLSQSGIKRRKINRPWPEFNLHSLEELEKSTVFIMETYRNNTQAAIILGGHFNADAINWDTCSILPDCKKKSICEKIIDIFDKCGLSQLQTAPTRMGATLDLFATNKPGLLKNINNIPGIADHDTLLIDSDIQAGSSKKPPRKVFKWSQGNWEELCKDTAEFAQKYLNEDTRSLEENYAAIDQHLKSALKKHIRSRYTRTRTDLLWLTQDLKREYKRKQRLCNRAKKTGKPEHKKRYKKSQKNVQRSVRQARWRYINGILQAGLGHSRQPQWPRRQQVSSSP